MNIFFISIGTFFHCESDLIEPAALHEKCRKNDPLCIKTKMDCLNFGGNWVNQEYNFDNIGSAIIYLFVLATTEGWVGLMEGGTDTIGINQ